VTERQKRPRRPKQRGPEERRPEERRAEPQRRCLGDGGTQPKSALLRFVVGPDGALVADLAERLPGRGFYVTASRARLERALKRGGFARIAGRRGLGPVRPAPDLADRVEALLAARLVELVSLANRAGQAAAGRDKAARALRAGRAALLLQARDGSPAETARTRALAGDLPALAPLDSAEMAQAFGRSAAVVEVAIAPGGLAGRILAETRRLAGFRPVPGLAPEAAGAGAAAGNGRSGPGG
jgi:hypothetical protein